ncbi:MAG TPA: methylenetetrahydrofolate reductase [NAD(P)H] [Candidatus Hydrogenedentes bacterium]|nr:methylenetetrahydrofolate reductase [NAD(P)H] [Candidatus Hydrogenedentota bacterium]
MGDPFLVDWSAIPFREVYRQAKPAVSFELFPPKTDEGRASLFAHLPELASCRPAYITCTYGAGGTSRDRTLNLLREVRQLYPGIPAGAHLACLGATRAYLEAFLEEAVSLGVDRIVALRGDPPRNGVEFQPAPDGFRHAVELVRLIRETRPDLGVIVAGYPETHPEAPSMAKDIDYLKEKVDAGADAIITQMFFENIDFLRFRDRCVAAGITVPIIPGILPVTSLPQALRMTELCGARMNPELVRRLEAHAGDEEGQYAVGVYYAARQVEELLTHGVPGVHFYVLNKSRAAALICRALVLF